MNNTTSLLIMLFCLISSAYFSATETAFSSLNKTKLKTMAEKGSQKALKTLEVSERYDKLLSTILIGNNIVNIALASFVNPAGDIPSSIVFITSIVQEMLLLIVTI